MTTIKEVEESWQRMNAAENEYDRLRRAYEKEHAPYKVGEWGARTTNPIVPFTATRRRYGADDMKIDQHLRVMGIGLVRHHSADKWMWRLSGNIVRKDGTDGSRREVIYEPVKEDS